MPYDGNGNFVRVHNWTADAANALDINSSEMDAEDSGFAAALSNAVTRDGQGKMSVDFLPNADNVLNLGSPSYRWASLNGVPIPSSASPWTYYGRTAAEAIAAVTPTNFFYQPGWVTRFGVDTSGATDSTTAFQNALTAAAKGAWFSATGGATVVIPSGALLKILGNVTVPPNVTVKGPQSFVGAGTADSKSCNYAAMGGSIALSSASSITMQAGSCLDGILIYRQGMTFPATDASAFAGTAITAGGDDWCVRNCMVLGFNQGISSDGYQRGKCFDVLMDNVNGIYINNSQDTLHLNRCHLWPFAVFRAGVTAAQMQRNGTGISINNSNDWGHISDCVTYGYQTGFLVNQCNSLDFTQCGADNTNNSFGSGFATQGVCFDIDFIGCQSAANISGYVLSHTVSGVRDSVRFIDCVAWGHTTHGFQITGVATGDVQIRGGAVRNCPNGITVANSNSFVDIDAIRVDQDVTTPFNVTVATGNVRIGNINDFGGVAAGTNPIGTGTNVAVQTVASAASVLLPLSGSDFLVSGTTNFGSLNYGWAGRQVTLYFQGALSVFNGTAGYNNMKLNGGANFVAAINSTLTLRHNGVQWFEIGRNA